jgi:hypothetical protein
VIELPHYTVTTGALRVWPARESEGRTCTWGTEFVEPEYGDVPVPHDVQPHETLWVVAPPIERCANSNEELAPPDFGYLVCQGCISHALNTILLAYRGEA